VANQKHQPERDQEGNEVSTKTVYREARPGGNNAKDPKIPPGHTQGEKQKRRTGKRKTNEKGGQGKRMGLRKKPPAPGDASQTNKGEGGKNRYGKGGKNREALPCYLGTRTANRAKRAERKKGWDWQRERRKNVNSIKRWKAGRSQGKGKKKGSRETEARGKKGPGGYGGETVLIKQKHTRESKRGGTGN